MFGRHPFRILAGLWADLLREWSCRIEVNGKFLRQVRNTLFRRGQGEGTSLCWVFRLRPLVLLIRVAEHDRAARNIGLRLGLTNYDVMFNGKMHNLKSLHNKFE